MSQNIIYEKYYFYHRHNSNVSFHVFGIVESTERNVVVRYDEKFVTSFRIPLHQEHNHELIEKEFIKRAMNLFDHIKVDVHKVVSVREQLAKKVNDVVVVVDVKQVDNIVIVDTLYHGKFIVIGYDVFKKI